MLKNLFDVSIKQSASESDSLGKLILNWNSIEHEIREKLENAGISGTYKWEEAFALGLVEASDVQLLTKLRMARNRLVHSETINREDVKYWLELSEKLLPKIKAAKPALSENGTSDQLVEVSAPADVIIEYSKLKISSDIHLYSLEISVKLSKTPDQDFFRFSFLWPKQIPISRVVGFEDGEEQNIDGKTYKEYALFVEKRLWPGQKMKIIGGKSSAIFEYEFNDKVYNDQRSKAFDMHYTLFLQSWQPVQGRVSFDSLNIY